MAGRIETGFLKRLQTLRAVLQPESAWLPTVPVAISVQSSFRLSLHMPTINTQGKVMNLSMSIGPIVALIAGIMILLIPRLLNYIVAVYLIVIGLIGLFGTGGLRI